MASVEVLTHLVAGTVAGASQLIVGHPFDSIKVKMQSAPGKTGALETTMKTFRNEGIVGLYRGMALPLATVALFNAILFSSRGAVNAMLKHSDGTPLTLAEHTFSSSCAGAVVSFVASPTELIKCRLQHQGTYASALKKVKEWEGGGKKGPAPTLYRGPLDVLQTIARNERGIRGLSNGLGSTLVREIPGNGIMFGVYEGLKMTFAQWQGLERTDDLGTLPLITAGGLGGMAFWVAMYPVDVIKSKLQTQHFGHEEYHGMMDCARKIMARDGISGLYRGVGPCLARAFPANATAFVAYEAAMQGLNGLRKTVDS